jgi:hypothetical protein
MTNQAYKCSNPGPKAKKEDNKSWHDQFQQEQNQSQNEPEKFRSGKNV